MTKKALRERCQQILHSDKMMTENDFNFLLNLLETHPDADRKIGCGVVKMWVGQNPTYPTTKCFFLQRMDWTTTDWSFMKCISKGNPFKAACRNAVYPQIKKFREDNKMDSTRHADHHPESFDSILKRFVDINGKGKLRSGEDNQSGNFLADEEYLKKWQDFHQREAVLRNISVKENLTKKR